VDLEIEGRSSQSHGGGNKEKEMESEAGGRSREKVLPQIYGLESSDEEDDIRITQSACATPRTASRKARLMQQARQYLSNTRVNIDSDQHDYPIQDELLSNDPEEITASFWYPDVAGWWMKQERRMGDYQDLARMARDIFSVMPHGVGVEASFSLGRDVMSWRQSRTKGETLQQKVVVRQWARSNDGFLPDEIRTSVDGESLDDERGKKEDEKLNQLASVRDFLIFKKESDNLRKMQKKLKGKDVAVSGMGYISDEDDGKEEHGSGIDHDGKRAFGKDSREKRPIGRNIELGSVTKVCNGNLVEKIRQVGRKWTVDGVGDSEDDVAISESEAIWMLTDSEVGDSDNDEEGENDGGEELREEENTEWDSEETTPNHGLLIPGFKKVVRRSARLEVRKQTVAAIPIQDKIKNGEQLEVSRARRKRF
jgi:hypothetical protein